MVGVGSMHGQRLWEYQHEMLLSKSRPTSIRNHVLEVLL